MAIHPHGSSHNTHKESAKDKAARIKAEDSAHEEGLADGRFVPFRHRTRRKKGPMDRFEKQRKK